MIKPWNNKLYIADGGVRRLTADGLFDPTFQALYEDPRVSTGATHVDFLIQPDGSLLVATSFILNDPVNGFVGTDFSLAWFTNTGALDTTKVHRRSNSLIYHLAPQADGRILCSAVSSTFEGQPVGRIFRILADGSLDPSLTTTVNAGLVFQLLPLPDGRFYACGRFRFQGETSFRYIVRFLPDGSLDPTFQNDLDFTWTDSPPSNLVAGLFPIEDGRYIVFGSFTHVDGVPRKSLCVIDSTGSLIDDLFTGPNCGDYVYQGTLYGSVFGITEASNGDLYIYGGYEGFNDGVINDPGQNLISRLRRVDTGMGEEQGTTHLPELSAYPSPANDRLTVRGPAWLDAACTVLITDVAGRVVLQGPLVQDRAIDLNHFAAGAYSLVVSDLHGAHRAVARFVKE